MCSPARGASGGIIALWYTVSTRAQVISHEPQSLHLLVKHDNREPWLLTIVYASINYVTRNKLWNAFDHLCFGDVPWLLIGDFNCIILSDDKRGGKSLY